MITTEDLLLKIDNCWNHFIWDSKYCRKYVNFTKEFKLYDGYYTDVVSYIEDTLKLLKNINYEKEYPQSLLQTVGILQIIYAQQDLIDELLYIFKLEKSVLQDKEPNRKIRNELIGHPIRRSPKDNQLISSVFVSKGFGNGLLKYVLYSNIDNFSGNEQLHKVDEIIKRHFVFLDKYVLLVWKKIKKILINYKKSLIKLDNLIDKNIDFFKLVIFVKQTYEKFSEYNYLYKQEILVKCYNQQAAHPRYKNTIELYLKDLRAYLAEKLTAISNMILEVDESNITFSNIPVDNLSNKNKSIVRKPIFTYYEFGKLHSNHPIFGIKYFKSKLKNHKEMLLELKNMELNIGDKLEYYSSYEYLEKLLLSKNLIS